MREFRPLTIERIEPESKDAVRIALGVPKEFESEYEFLAGQHLPFQVTIDGKKLRRTYSICSAQGEQPLEIGRSPEAGHAPEIVPVVVVVWPQVLCAETRR